MDVCLSKVDPRTQSSIILNHFPLQDKILGACCGVKMGRFLDEESEQNLDGYVQGYVVPASLSPLEHIFVFHLDVPFVTTTMLLYVFNSRQRELA